MRARVSTAVFLWLFGCGEVTHTGEVVTSEDAGARPASDRSNPPSSDAGADDGVKTGVPSLHVLAGEVASVTATCGLDGKPPTLVGAKAATDTMELTLRSPVGSSLTAKAAFAWLESGGIHVTYEPGNLEGTVARIEALMNVTIKQYARPDGSIFYAPDRDPTVIVGLTSIEGLDDCARDAITATTGASQ